MPSSVSFVSLLLSLLPSFNTRVSAVICLRVYVWLVSNNQCPVQPTCCLMWKRRFRLIWRSLWHWYRECIPWRRNYQVAQSLVHRMEMNDECKAGFDILKQSQCNYVAINTTQTIRASAVRASLDCREWDSRETRNLSRDRGVLETPSML